MRRSRVVLYIVAFAVAIGMLLLICGLRGLLTEDVSPRETIVILCDAFFVPGIIFICFGALGWASDKGAFDGLGYSVSSLFNLHKPVGRGLDWKEKESYQEYIERKHAARSNAKSSTFLFVIGGMFVLISLVFLIINSVC